jgi:predicted metal-dependent enzyme (double-stranded beta helix superfamily)
VSDAALLSNDIRERLDAAVGLQDLSALTDAVKHTLQDGLRDGTLAIPAGMRQPRTDTYARRLLYRDPNGRYSMVVMTWGPGQKTALHDHAGIWCVECVMDGSMEVAQYDLRSEHNGQFRFERQNCVHAGRGAAGCLIPPFEYHTLGNVAETPSVTLHVYGGDMTYCHVFEPQPDGAWSRVRKALSFHE